MKVGLAHRRLSIIDLVEGKQPMVDKAAKLTITFNGEIYNYISLKNELKEKGHIFLTNSDTSYFKSIYAMGDCFLEKLTGMFAFCIYDQQRNLLVIARDRAGEKPIYYYDDDNGLIFASELKALMEDNSIRRKFVFRCLNTILLMVLLEAPDV